MSALEYINKFLSNYTSYKDYWNYEDGCVLMGCKQLYEVTNDELYFNFIVDYADPLICNDGTIINFQKDKYNCDSYNSGKILFMLYDKTGDEKYRKAIEFLIENLKKQPRTKNGSFFHKGIYPNQIWLDGLYMVEPFYTEYLTRFADKGKYDDILIQYRNVRDKMFDKKKKLYYHGYDDALIQVWADKKTGVSSSFWLRGIGWYLMSLVDVIDLIPVLKHNEKNELCEIFKEAIDGVLMYQDKVSKLFYQLVDLENFDGNYTETSGSCMIGYCLLKAYRSKILTDKKYIKSGVEIIESVEKNKLVYTENGQTLTDICLMAGLGPEKWRDGSNEYYISEKIVSDDSKGVGAFMMAYAQKLQFENGK